MDAWEHVWLTAVLNLNHCTRCKCDSSQQLLWALLLLESFKSESILCDYTDRPRQFPSQYFRGIFPLPESRGWETVTDQCHLAGPLVSGRTKTQVSPLLVQSLKLLTRSNWVSWAWSEVLNVLFICICADILGLHLTSLLAQDLLLPMTTILWKRVAQSHPENFSGRGGIESRSLHS